MRRTLGCILFGFGIFIIIYAHKLYPKESFDFQTCAKRRSGGFVLCVVGIGLFFSNC